MDIQIKFNTDNAAFEEDFLSEVGHILNRAYRKINANIQYDASGEPRLEDTLTLLDTNGNSIGTITAE